MAAKTMAESVALMGQKLDTVCTTVTKIDEGVEALKKSQAATDIHLKSIIGPPSLEDRVNLSMDQKDAHKQTNVMQAITNVQTILTLQQENTALKLESNIASVAEALKVVAKSVEHTEAMRKENNDAQLRWQDGQEKVRADEKEKDTKWKSAVERKINIFLGIVIGVEAMFTLAFKFLDFFKH